MSIRATPGIVLLAIICLVLAAMIVWLSENHNEKDPKLMQPTDEKSNQPVHPSRETRLSRLASEKSPYLLDHADNPVDWYPWSPEAFQKARDEDKPIFLSIGYSSCHWCQVMEEESFMDREVAELLNKYFVSIKVDREERPDIDAIYMSVCQVLTGGGGWPLTVLLTPDTKPFFAGTYFPKRGLLGRPGLMDILQQVAALWENRRERLLRAADEITGAMQSIPSAWPGDQLDEDTLREACRELEAEFDREHGGFGQAPKFPTAHILLFLLRWWKRTGESESLAMVEKTLSAMHRGGIYDHLGFGFHRYSTDDTWHVPHFEKMLYDQAMLALAYVETYQATGKDFYARIATEVFEYVMREMAAPNGGFYSSENADSEGEEGRFYVWSLEEIKDILGEERGGIFCRFYNVTSEGNFEDGLNILYVDGSVEDFVREGISRVDLEEILRQARKDLLGVRNKRVRPSKDDKILTDWNGLMIAALARGAGVLDRRAYAKAAAEAADFLLERLRGKDGRLMHRYRDGDAAVPGFIDDYAFLTWGLIELYEATFEVKYLREAIRLTDEMLEIFWDEESGGFYFTGEDSEKLIVRTKDIFDAAIPSGNSVAALNLLRLARMTARSDLEERADRLMEVFSGAVDRSPSDCAQLLVALDFALGPTKEIVIAGEPADRRVDEMVRAVWGRFLPRKVLLFHPAGRAGEAIEEIAPFTKNQVPVGDAPTAYVCENYTCKLPVTDVSRLVSVLEEP